MSKLVFGQDRTCGACGGDGAAHRFHVEVVGHRETNMHNEPQPIRKHVPCTEHPCLRCGGKGTVKA